MDQHERVDAALRDEPRGDDGLAKCGGRCQDASLVAQDGVSCGLLFLPQVAVKLHIQRTTVVALVANDHANTKLGEHLANVIEAAAAARCDAEILGARDDAGLVACRKPHRLRFVELGVLQRQRAKQSISKSREALLGMRSDCQGQVPTSLASPDDREPLFDVTEVRSKALFLHHLAVATVRRGCGLVVQRPRRSLQSGGLPILRTTREKRPLVGPRNKGAIKKDSVVLFARSPLERQSNQVSNLRHRVLIRKQPVVRIETDIRTPLHCLGEDMRSQSSGKRGWNGSSKKTRHAPRPERDRSSAAGRLRWRQVSRNAAASSRQPALSKSTARKKQVSS